MISVLKMTVTLTQTLVPREDDDSDNSADDDEFSLDDSLSLRTWLDMKMLIFLSNSNTYAYERGVRIYFSLTY